MTPCNRWKRWSDKGIPGHMLHALPSGNRKIRTLTIDTTVVKVQRTAGSLRLLPRKHRRKPGRTRGGPTCRLHLVTDTSGRPIPMYLTAGNVGECKGARALPDVLPKAKAPVADRGYDADRFREKLTAMGLIPASRPGETERRKLLVTGNSARAGTKLKGALAD